MNWLIKWEYVDPANEQTYQKEEALNDCTLAAAFQWALDNLPIDQLIEVAFVEYSQ